MIKDPKITPEGIMGKIRLESLQRKYMHAFCIYTDSNFSLFFVESIHHGKQLSTTEETEDTYQTAKLTVLTSRWLNKSAFVSYVARSADMDAEIADVVTGPFANPEKRIFHGFDAPFILVRALGEALDMKLACNDTYRWIDLPGIEPAYYYIGNSSGQRVRSAQFVGSQYVPRQYAQAKPLRYLAQLAKHHEPVIPCGWISHSQMERLDKWKRVAIDVQGSPNLERRQIARRTRWMHDIYEYTGKCL